MGVWDVLYGPFIHCMHPRLRESKTSRVNFLLVRGSLWKCKLLTQQSFHVMTYKFWVSYNIQYLRVFNISIFVLLICSVFHSFHSLSCRLFSQVSLRELFFKRLHGHVLIMIFMLMLFACYFVWKPNAHTSYKSIKYRTAMRY